MEAKDIPEIKGTNVRILAGSPQCKLGEGPIWHPKFNAFYWIDISDEKLLRWDPSTDKTDIFVTDRKYTSLAATSEGLIASCHNFLWRLSLPDLAATKLFETSPLDEEKVRFNDGKVTPEGKYFVGSIHLKIREKIGSLYSYGYSGENIQDLNEPVVCFNGPNWSMDGKQVRWADSAIKALYAGDWDSKTGQISNKKVFAEIPEELAVYPDGATVDSEGNIYWALFSGSGIMRLNPQGEITGKISLPAQWITSVAFGGEDMRTLLVTSCNSLTAEKNPEPEGMTFVVTFDDENIKGQELAICNL
eukprot:CAMPEP_0115009468 /NCGR_PEP_ID=MMETSP0216-20121206/22639_1 /TAXON_ID=223996 /ORGANISM="Protocruzia adherens, Strain Boccale" /LENGTH=303 /DNA_ID=CAMNT_0002377299 /DNA_START=169 /DNA_END=1080 /DNA_ORIENTATION=-